MENIMKKDYIIGICSVGESYHQYTRRLIEQINALIEIEFIVLTDKVEEFNSYSNVNIIKYNRPIFSFHDKRLLFEEGFKNYDSVLLLDADHIIRNDKKEYIVNFTAEDVKPGAYPQIVWNYPADCSMEHFLKGLTSRVPYGIKFRKFCMERRLLFNNALLIQESCLFIKDTKEKINTFLAVWKELQMFCEEQDIEREQHILGYGEGYSIGVSLNASSIPVIQNNTKTSQLFETFQHFAWEPLSE